MKFIESKDNALIKKFRSLSVKKYREQFSLFKLEGEKVVLECLKLNGVAQSILIDQDYQADFQDVIEKENNKVIIVKHEVFVGLSSTNEPQHIMAICSLKNAKLVDLKAPKFLVLDHLQDPGNLGTIIRSAVASGFLDLVLIDSVDPFNDKTIRSASGTIFYPKFYNLTYEEFINFSNANNYTIVLADMGKQSVFDKNLIVPEKYALVIGNEGNGVSKIIRNEKHFTLSIPMAKEVESLNAGVSASILMFMLANR